MSCCLGSIVGAQDLFLSSASVKSENRGTCRANSNTDVAVTHYRRIAVTTISECCDACVADRRCKAAVFKTDHCNLKDALKLVNSTAEFVTVLPDYHPAPPPPPSPPSPPPTPPSPPPGTKNPMHSPEECSGAEHMLPHDRLRYSRPWIQTRAATGMLALPQLLHKGVLSSH